MRGFVELAAVVGLALMVGGCDAGGEEAEGVGDAPVSTPGATQVADSASHDAHDAAQGASADNVHAHAGTGEPRPLLPIMQQLGTDMIALTHALMTDSTVLVAHAAEAIAHHPPIAQDDIARIQATLGEEMAEFERLDEEVHEASVRLHEAAQGGSSERVLTLLNEVQRGCVACHAQFRDRLRTNAPR